MAFDDMHDGVYVKEQSKKSDKDVEKISTEQPHVLTLIVHDPCGLIWFPHNSSVWFQG